MTHHNHATAPPHLALRQHAIVPATELHVEAHARWNLSQQDAASFL